VHQAVRAASRLTALARDLDTTPAAAAIAFALWNPLVSTALFGATSVAQVEENVGALALVDRLDHFHLTELRQQVG
jgi:aryl-alcohol dehydrogenase-like predicted oxidoreductase